MSKNCPVHDNALKGKTDFQYFEYTNTLQSYNTQFHAIRPENKKNCQIFTFLDLFQNTFS